jgi:acyl-CoA thioesterase FadM
MKTVQTLEDKALVRIYRKDLTVSSLFRQEIFRDDKLLVKANTVLVCVGKNFKPMAIPDAIKKGLSL